MSYLELAKSVRADIERNKRGENTAIEDLLLCYPALNLDEWEITEPDGDLQAKKVRGSYSGSVSIYIPKARRGIAPVVRDSNAADGEPHEIRLPNGDRWRIRGTEARPIREAHGDEREERHAG